MIRGLLIVGLTMAALSSHSTNQFIVKYRKGVSPSQARGLFSQGGMPLFEGSPLSEKQGLYTVKFSMGLRPLAIQEQLDVLRSLPEVEYAQLDHPLTMRGQRDLSQALFSNEETYDEHMETLHNFHDISPQNPGTANVLAAWSEWGTGSGRNALDQEIVVAVIDAGIELNHEDLADNIFVNPAEIPGNGLDDDNNGHIDDVSGWNISNNSAIVFSDYYGHGTHVAGIIGARGGNGIGVAGVNWKVKILPVQIGGEGTLTSKVVKAYNYIIAMKRRWLLSGGWEGANIVVTNSSFGLDRADCNSGEYPIWNKLYNEMGRLGILSVVATANNPYDVDEVGDVPSTCSSDAIVAVTTLGRDGKIPQGHAYGAAAWGKKSIDMGAPGVNIYSTVTDSWYSFLSGTSMATPHITGAIAYMHSVATQSFALTALKHPEFAAQMLKKILLDSAAPVDSMENAVTSGGALDLAVAATAIGHYQVPSQGPNEKTLKERPLLLAQKRPAYQLALPPTE